MDPQRQLDKVRDHLHTCFHLVQVSAVGHDHQAVVTEPTCVAAGRTEGKHCAVCGGTETREIAPLGGITPLVIVIIVIVVLSIAAVVGFMVLKKRA